MALYLDQDHNNALTHYCTKFCEISQQPYWTVMALYLGQDHNHAPHTLLYCMNFREIS
jgi:hypothetical protein